MSQSLIHNRGYTLIELLLYVGIVSTLLVGITLYFASVAEARVKNQTIMEVEQQGAMVMDHITNTVRNATSVSAPAIGSSANQLTVVVPTGSLSPTIFDLSSEAIRIKEGVAAAIALTSSDIRVTSLSFTNMSRSATVEVVRVTFTMSHVNPSNRNEYDYEKIFTSSVTLR